MIVTAYPFALILLAILLNTLVLGISSIVVSSPASESVRALILAVALLVINHTWIMNSTELTRTRHGLHSNPEEWAASGDDPEKASAEGLDEVEMRHNAHRNTTENTVYFVLLSLIFVVVSPPELAVQVWTIGYAAARLGYTYSYLNRKVALRGVFMSLSLLAMYGMASYLFIGLFLG
ncbi:MAG: MAPEG family protein [Woeseiaceae bacterium]